MPSRFEHWQEWRQRCAVLRCHTDTQSALRKFGWQQFTYYARHVLGENWIHAQIPSERDCWHLLESELTASGLRSGRRYKEWLFARLEGSRDAPIDVIQGGASLLMRSVVRNWAFNETRPPKTASLDAPIAQSDGLTLADLLPAQANLTDYDLQQSANLLASTLFESLDQRARMILLAKQLQLPLYDTQMLQLIGTGRSNVSKIWRGIYQRLAQQIAKAYAHEPRDWQLELSLLSARRLEEKTFSWGRVEKKARTLFFMVEHRQTNANRHTMENYHET